MLLRKAIPRVIKTVRAEVILVACFAAWIMLTIWFVAYSVDTSQHHWCQALATLTEHSVPKPANPAANPSREEAYVLYQEFLALRGEFECGT